MNRSTAVRIPIANPHEQAIRPDEVVRKNLWRRLDGVPVATFEQLQRAVAACAAVATLRISRSEKGDHIVEQLGKSETGSCEVDSLFSQAVSDVVLRDRIAEIADRQIVSLVEGAIYRATGKG